MGEMINLLKKSVKKAAYHCSPEAKQILKIKKLPRYQPGQINILGHDFTFVDSASFLGQYFSILKGNVYNFKADNDTPYIIDCGANIGVSILYFKKLYPKSTIVAFEPDQHIFSVLKKNIEIKKYKNVTLINKGLWNKEGKMKFIAEGADAGSIFHNNESVHNNVAVAEIETTSLRSYLNNKVEFLKIDIEGAESVVIEDCEDLLQNVQRIFIEYHSNINEPQRLDLILSALTKNGFRYFIESAILNNESPFIERLKLADFDNFLNIYAYK